jgi:plasmid stabilization system protein ParE
MGAWRVALSDQADRDLERVVAFLARKNPAAAERIGLEIVRSFSPWTRCRLAATR